MTAGLKNRSGKSGKKDKLTLADSLSRILMIGLAAGYLVGYLAGCATVQTPQDSRAAEASREIGEAYMRQGDYTAALRELLKAEELDPKDHIVQNDLGLSYMAKNRMEEAVAHFQKSIALKPSYAPARNNLGTAYLTLKEWDLAIENFREITKDVLYVTPHFPLSNMGTAYYYKGDYATALKYYKEALKLQPDFANAVYGVGRCYIAMNQPQMALRYLEQAVKLNPKAPDYHFLLAETYQMLGNNEQARASYMSVVDIAPQDNELNVKARQRLGLPR